MPREDVTIAQGSDTRAGYSTAVQTFCSAANGKTVEPGGYLSMATEVFLNGGKNPASYGVVGFVYCELYYTELPKQSLIRKKSRSTTRLPRTMSSRVSLQPPSSF
jgi:hypothetical protein